MRHMPMMSSVDTYKSMNCDEDLLLHDARLWDGVGQYRCRGFFWRLVAFGDWRLSGREPCPGWMQVMVRGRG